MTRVPMIRSTFHGPARCLVAVGLLAAATQPAHAQRPAEGTEAAAYVTVDAEAVALQGVTLVDGTGGAIRSNQTIVIEGNRITAVGAAGDVAIPEGAEVLDLSGHTVMPGMIGLHDHLFYMAAGGRMHPMSYTGQRLYWHRG